MDFKIYQTMRYFLSTLLLLFSGLTLSAQEKMYIHQTDNFTLGALVASTDSIFFSTDGNQTFFSINGSIYEKNTDDIDSLTFGANSSTIYIHYTGNDAEIINPLAFEGVSVVKTGAYVTVTSTTSVQDINYALSGTTSNGNFKIYSEKRYNLYLNGVNIVNPVGPAINVQSEKKTTVILSDGTTSILADGETYDPAPVGPSGETEDQDAAFFSEAHLVFTGNGQLTIHGYGDDQHGLNSDDEIEFNGGNLTIASAVKDGIHANDGVFVTAGTINVTSTGDGIDGDEANILISGGSITVNSSTDDVKAISCDSTLVVTGGNITITVSGDQSKAMKSDQDITLSGGTITIHTSGNVVLEAAGSGFDPSYCTAIKSESDVTLSGAEITIITTGIAGKAISSDSDVNMSAGSVTITSSGNGARYTNSSGVFDAYVSTCFSTDGNLSITGGTVTASNSGSGGKALSSDGSLTIGSSTGSPTIQLTTTGTKILISGSGSNAEYAESKTVKSDGDIVINNGTITIASADDGLKSETAIIVNGGVMDITNSIEGVEAPNITFNSGSVKVKSSDDCINATYGNGGEQNDGSLLTISGGQLVCNTTGGDGLDSNGNILITGGTTIVHGPPSNPEVGMDYNGSCNLNGGFLVISGTNSNMTQAPSNTSTQNSIKAMSNQSMSSTTLFHLQDASGNNILTFQPIRNYYSIVFSSNELLTGSSYSIYTGGSYTGGTNNNGLYTGGTYTAGTFKKTFTISSRVTNVTF